jgi:hypothetical protein
VGRRETDLKEEDGDAFIARERAALESIHFVSSLDRAPV